MQTKFLIGGLIITAAVVYLVISATKATAEYYLTVSELQDQSDQYLGQNVRISGAVIGDSIHYDPTSLMLQFTIADIPGDEETIAAEGGLSRVLQDAVVDPERAHLEVVYNGPQPDMLTDEAQAILTGSLGSDGVFYANEVLMKCPSRYEEASSTQILTP
jgi:cytochrome c-type biogenesis protein CcmE